MAFPFANKKVLVTGGAGFIGSHVADRLVAEGCEVHVLDNLSGGVAANVPEGATFHELDVRSDEVPALFERERFDALCHLAAQMDVRRSVADPVFDADVNVLGLLNLMEAGRQNGLSRVAFASTGGGHLRRAGRGRQRRSIAAGGPPDAADVAVRDHEARERALPPVLRADARDFLCGPSVWGTSTGRARTRTARPAWSPFLASGC